MKTIGMIGGMSWESTSLYYSMLNELVRARMGGLHSADVLLRSVDFAIIEQMQAEGRWEDAGRLLADIAERLEAGGAQLIVLCTNTMHKVADYIEKSISVPFLHLADATAQAVVGQGIERVGLLGTAYTMDEPFYRERLEASGLEVIIPSREDRSIVHTVIFDELCVGVIRDESRQRYRDVMGRLVSGGAQGVILGCTEIEMLITQEDSAVPVFSTTRIHVEAAVAHSISSNATDG